MSAPAASPSGSRVPTGTSRTTAAPGVTAQEQPAGKLTFTVGIINDVDSLNPFIGILAETYEVWALMYDYLVGYSQKDFSPVPGLAES